MVKGKKQSPVERRGDNIIMYFIFVKLYRVSGHHLFLFCLLNIDFFLNILAFISLNSAQIRQESRDRVKRNEQA